MRKSLLLFLFLLASCTPQPILNNHPWAVSLRALDPADTPTPAYDLTAVYLRQQDDALQIRVDVLDFNDLYELSIDIQIDDASAPGTIPYNIHIPSESLPARITLDPLLATATVTIPIFEIPSHPRVDVSTPEDHITGLTLDGPSPTQTASLLLTFYDTFPARLPAEALRSWDGAHTGPRGERHGLKHLLDAVEEYQMPIVLLDLKTPENLSALDAMGVLPRIKNLADEGLLILPENKSMLLLPSQAQSANMDFGLPASPFSYPPETSGHQFGFLEDATHIYHPLFGKTTYIPIAAETDTSQPATHGPSLEVRQALLETALNTDAKDVLVLGGSLRDSTWGNPDMVGPTLAYFASRPYIHVLNADDLLSFPTNANNKVIKQPEESEDEQILQFQSTLEFAQSWAETPLSNPIYHCQPNLPAELPDCVLANGTYLAIFDTQTGSLTFFFTQDETGLHQLIGPSWQVAPGIDLYPAAFVDDKGYQANISGNSITFTSTDGIRAKTFTLTESGLEVSYQTQEPTPTQIPLLVDPWMRFAPGWAEKYMQENTPGGIAWGLRNGPMIGIQFEGQIAMRAFNESLALLASPEDPDFEYPPGHFIPFPMAVAEVEMQDGYFLRLERLP